MHGVRNTSQFHVKVLVPGVIAELQASGGNARSSRFDGHEDIKRETCDQLEAASGNA